MITVIIAVEDQIFWGIQILILPKSNQICHNLNHLCPNFAQISTILPKHFSLGDAAASSALTALAVMDQFPEER